MNIDFAERFDLVRGAAFARHDENGLWLHRMTEELLEHYNYSEPAAIRARCAPGVSLEFVSDTGSIHIACRHGRVSRSYFAIDVLCDGEWISRCGGTEPESEWSGELFFSRERKPRHFRIFFSHCSETSIREFSVDDGASMDASGAMRRTWLLIGDSITQGMSAVSQLRTYDARIARRLDLDRRNIAVGGAKYEQAVGELAGKIDCDIASIAFGTNDFNAGLPVDQIAKEANALVGSLLAAKPGLPIAFISAPAWIGREGQKNDAGYSIEELRKEVAEAVKDFASVRIVRGNEMIPENQEYFADAVHPNETGFLRYAENLAPIIKEMLGMP